jgi:hypothetical protein
MPNAIDNPELYEAVTLGSLRSPGVVDISGHDRKIGWDVKSAPGQSGATTTRTSEDPIEFECAFYLATADDFARWPQFLAKARSTITGKTPVALDIYHPDLAEVDIKSVVLAGIGGVERDDDQGETRKLRFLEYRPPVPKGGTPKKAKGIDPKDPNAAALAELDALSKKYEQTPWK